MQGIMLKVNLSCFVHLCCSSLGLFPDTTGRGSPVCCGAAAKCCSQWEQMQRAVRQHRDQRWCHLLCHSATFQCPPSSLYHSCATLQTNHQLWALNCLLVPSFTPRVHLPAQSSHEHTEPHLADFEPLPSYSSTGYLSAAPRHHSY